MLTKPQNVTFISGRPAVPSQPAYEVCTTTGGGTAGHWEQVCETVRVLVGVAYGPVPGAIPPDPGPFPHPIYAGAYTCRAVWVDD